ncbi:hypothetical protein EIB18_11025 [Caulobacter vibrioides]|uniref:hypothetical protein n=1 Tax=Caulobacter vibrioides TaxID=155892 RepID=UPI000BB49B6E|nr:hypothetical protein [Caulobacter vibrioides]ATC25037.1 hypothetical protein CA608_11120 [Caulobacter vibrioides]AZH13192.1 hypothetical protein EIB18_11025 [Caulobacter vibrioides]PLR09816.1 hypothetical protein CVUC_16570 [Caulobacter vibrioides]
MGELTSMRRVALGCLLTVTGLAVVGTATALSTHVPEEFNRTLTLAGGPKDGASVDDPDAPIATARYGGERARAVAAEVAATPAAATVALAGGPAETGLAGAAPSRPEPAPRVQTLAQAEAPKTRTTARILTEAAQSHPRPVLALTHTKTYRPYGKVLKAEVGKEPLPFTPLGMQPSLVKRLSLNASNLVSKAGASAEDLRRGRWMLFAASSGKAYSLNLVRDTIDGWRNAGFSEDKLARFGSRQVGIGYRKNNNQVSLSATRRKLNSIDYSNKDTVVGVTVSIQGR